MAVPDGEDAVIADRDSMGISAEVLNDPRGAIKGWFAIDDPLLMIKMSPERFESAVLLEMADAAGEYEITRFEVVFEEVKELASEQGRHDPYGNEKPFAT
jgi:hypothetical protein